MNNLVAEYALKQTDATIGVADYKIMHEIPKYLSDAMLSIEDYQNIEKWMREFYPEIFSHKYYDMRMKYYTLEANIRLLPKFSENEELRQVVIKIIDDMEIATS